MATRGMVSPRGMWRWAISWAANRTKGEGVRDEPPIWNINIDCTLNSIGEITILDAKKSGMYPLQIERVLDDSACA